MPCRCKSRFCEGCAAKLAGQTRDDLLRVKHLIRSPRLLTLTVDPKRHASPEAALDHVRKGEYIRKLMNRLGIRIWCWVLEFQRNGFPHWHVLIDVADLPRRRVDYRLAHQLWRKWGVGEQVDFTRDCYADAAHAVMYISKYLTKPPRNGWPPFVYGMERAPRVIGMCRELSAAIRDASPEPDDGDTEGEERGPRTPTGRTVGERVSLCQESTMLIHEFVTPEGEVGRRFLGVVEASLQDLGRESSRLGVRFTPDVVHYDDRAAIRWVIECPRVPTPYLADALGARVKATPIPAARVNRVEYRLAAMRGEIASDDSVM
ncbi:MAG: hypothetical protein ACF8QF_14795 [Phycisphaerales bacterium]